ncbi:MAG: hypothetical protein WC521_02880 [Bdellovibrionales bacterium]
MIDSIGSATNFPPTSRAVTLTQPHALRSSSILTAVQAQMRESTAVAPVKVFSVPDASKSNATSSMARLPRGSLVDLLA